LDLDTRGVAPVAQGRGARGRNGATSAPKANSHCRPSVDSQGHDRVSNQVIEARLGRRAL